MFLQGRITLPRHMIADERSPGIQIPEDAHSFRYEICRPCTHRKMELRVKASIVFQGYCRLFIVFARLSGIALA